MIATEEVAQAEDSYGVPAAVIQAITETDKRTSSQEFPEPEPEEQKPENPHPLVGKCRIKGCSGKLQDHTPDGQNVGLLLKCEKCGFPFSFTPAPSQFNRAMRRGIR